MSVLAKYYIKHNINGANLKPCHVENGSAEAPSQPPVPPQRNTPSETIATNGHSAPEPNENDKPSQMIRIDYYGPRKKLAAPTNHPIGDDLQSISPVSSIQEEFYSYLGISSKSADADVESQQSSSAASPPLSDEYDLSKRRSLRVRIVNKWKQHQAKLMQLEEINNCSHKKEEDADSGEQPFHAQLPAVAVPFEERSGNIDVNCNSLEKRSSMEPFLIQQHIVDETVQPIATILERRCYTKEKPSQTPSTNPVSMIFSNQK